MFIANNIKIKIEEEFNLWKDKQYADKTEEERQKFGQFFTVPSLTIQMLENPSIKDGSLSKLKILDPTCGCGGLLVAAIICGASPNNIYGIELDKIILQLCKERLNEYCDKNSLSRVPDENIHWGNSLCAGCYEFPKKNEKYYFDEKKQEGKITIFKNFGGIKL